MMMLPAIMLLASCVKDAGNYNYKTLTPILIDTASLPAKVIKKQLEYVVLSPDVKQGNDNSNLEYEWRLVQAGYTPDPVTGLYYNEKISDKKDLNYKLTANSGDYIIVLNVKDRTTGITESVKINLLIESYASQGLMVLHGDKDSCDVSIIVNDRLNLGWTTDFVQHNVFSETNGRKIDGEGAFIYYNLQKHWVNVFVKGAKGGYRTSGNDLRILSPYSEMFMSPLSASEIDFNAFDMWSYNELLINKGDLYFTSQASVNVDNKYGVKCFGADYYAAPYVATNIYRSYFGVIYDQKNKRFLYIDGSKNIKTFKDPGAAAAFSMNNVGKEMVYAEHGYDSRWYCVMQSPMDPATRELYVCKFNVADDGNRGVAKYNIKSDIDLNNAEFFAFGNRGNVMYYATKTKVYQSNYSGDLSSVLRLDLSSYYAGYEIVSMKIYKVAGSPNESKLLYVAIYNPLDKQGKVLEIGINEVSGEMSLSNMKTYSGFKKISAINYKSK